MKSGFTKEIIIFQGQIFTSTADAKYKVISATGGLSLRDLPTKVRYKEKTS